MQKNCFSRKHINAVSSTDKKNDLVKFKEKLIFELVVARKSCRKILRHFYAMCENLFNLFFVLQEEVNKKEDNVLFKNNQQIGSTALQVRLFLTKNKLCKLRNVDLTFRLL